MVRARRYAPASACGVAVAWMLLSSRAVEPAAAGAPQLPLAVLLTVSASLPDAARGTLTDEAERIWRREQVELRWTRAVGGQERPDAPLRVLVIPRVTSPGGDDERWTVAELLPHTGERALAIASIDGAQRVISQARRQALFDVPGMTEYRLGLVLGRAVAHEIGHFLLATAGHADAGLMRASVDAHEFSAVGVDSFHLDPDARSWIRARIAGGPRPIAELRAEGFSYRR